MKKFFSLKGRATRLEFWRVQLVCVAVSALALALASWVTLWGGWLGAIPLVVIALLLLLSIATSLRRLHDRGKGVWWLILFNGVPFAAACVAQALIERGSLGLLAGALLLLGAISLNLWGWIEIGFRRGHPGPNRFGDDPSAVLTGA